MTEVKGGDLYSIGSTIRDIIFSQQPVAGCEPTTTHSVKKMVFGYLYSLVPKEVSCCKVARWSKLMCAGSNSSHDVFSKITQLQRKPKKPTGTFHVLVPIQNTPANTASDNPL